MLCSLSQTVVFNLSVYSLFNLPNFQGSSSVEKHTGMWKRVSSVPWHLLVKKDFKLRVRVQLICFVRGEGEGGRMVVQQTIINKTCVVLYVLCM